MSGGDETPKARAVTRVSKHGTPKSHSEPTETWAKTSERAAITRRSRKAPITMPKMPWDNKEEK